MNTQILFRSRPTGEPHESNFRVEKHGIPTPLPGEILCRTIYLSLDPYMRVRMYEEETYAPGVDFGDVMVGATIGQIVESHVEGWKDGEFVRGTGGWQNYWISDGSDLRRVDPAIAPLPAWLGVLGMPGLTAWVAVREIGRPAAGETMVVSAAAGAVGSVAGQIGKIAGANVVGIAGSDEKCAWVVGDLGFDACIHYKKEDVDRELSKHCPDGVDVYVENVGGLVGETVYRHLKIGGRVPLVGLIAHYNERKHHSGPGLEPILYRRAVVTGMIVRDHWAKMPEFEAEMCAWLREGRMKHRETIVDGIEEAPRAFIGLFHGQNVGKMVVRVADDPTVG
jgi:NADPH-dependent curcumin reductase CurA